MKLARELLDDIELDRLPADKLLLKVSRLARLTGSETIRKWLNLEMLGYNGKDPVSLEYMGRTLRWTNYEKKEGFWGSLAVQEAAINSAEVRIKQLEAHDGADALTVSGHRLKPASCEPELSKCCGIRSVVMALLHGSCLRHITRGYLADLQKAFSKLIGQM